ncbi:hypothetical protein KAS14_06260 [Candidatus Bathyarchaeota archaeon]|nr:hypothetical protein [Candidatus Bathyarchaeota archaeon]
MSDVAKKIKDYLFEIESYWYDLPSEIDRGVNSLKEIENLINNLDEETVEKALILFAGLYQRAIRYSYYIPTTVTNFTFIKEWLEKNQRESRTESSNK